MKRVAPGGAPSHLEREPILPPRERAAELIPPRDGVTWRISGDARIFGASGYALLLRSPTLRSARG